MEESNRESERIARIAAVDAVAKSPQQRALAVYEAIKDHSEFTNWDIICFACEYLAMQAAQFDWLRELIKPLAAIVYAAHYYEGESIGLYTLKDKNGIEPSTTPNG